MGMMLALLAKGDSTLTKAISFRSTGPSVRGVKINLIFVLIA
jgi:hypothetical protein